MKAGRQIETYIFKNYVSYKEESVTLMAMGQRDWRGQDRKQMDQPGGYCHSSDKRRCGWRAVEIT